MLLESILCLLFFWWTHFNAVLFFTLHALTHSLTHRNGHIFSRIYPQSLTGHINCRSASPGICFTLRRSKPAVGGESCKAVICFHRGVLSLGKCNRLEYQWDVPESVTAHLLSDCGFGTVSLRSGGRLSFLLTLSAPCFPANSFDTE